MPRSITFTDFGTGKDLRKNPSVSEASRLLQLLNGRVTTGKAIAGRPGTSVVADLETGTKGLIPALGKLQTFYHSGSISHANSLFNANKIIGSVDVETFSGSGLDDAKSGGEFTGGADAVFEVEIDATGTPDTFKWRKDGGAWTTGVSITGSAQTLSDGVTVLFGATTGHTLADKWTINAYVVTGINEINYSDTFAQALYVSATYSNNKTRHHYLDGNSPTWIQDRSCPNGIPTLKIEGKMFSGENDSVPFSASENVRNWTLANDAGSLGTGRRQKGSETVIALGQYQKKGLVVFHIDGSQLWDVDPDPALHVYKQGLVGTQTRYPRSIAPLFSDLYYLSDAGFRSISESVLSDNKAEVDVGSPLDSEVVQDLVPGITPIGTFYHKGGQYWCCIGGKTYVFTSSRTAKISAWSVYQYPFSVSDVAELDGVLYLRTADRVLKVDDTVYRDSVETGKAIVGFADNGSGGTRVESTGHGRAVGDEVIIATSGAGTYAGTHIITAVSDANHFDIAVAFVADDGATTYTAGTIFETEIGLPFVNGKKPGLSKQWLGFDLVATGTWDVSFKYNPNDQTLETQSVELSGDTSFDEMNPMEMISTSIAPVLKNNRNEERQFDALTLYFETLGSQ